MSVAPAAPARTRWNVIAAAVGAGIIGAAHIGKVPAALPAMRAELGLDLIAAGWVVSIYSATGMTLGMLIGVFADRIGHRALAVAGVALMGLGSALGVFADGAAMLLVTRFLEGFGFVIAVVTAPSLIARAAGPAHRKFAFGLWGTFMSTGLGTMLLLSPLLLGAWGWRGSWLVMAAASFAWAGHMALALRSIEPLPAAEPPFFTLAAQGAAAAEPPFFTLAAQGAAAAEPPPRLDRGVAAQGAAVAGARGSAWNDLRLTAAAAGPWLLALCFGCYTLVWTALMVWLPTFLVEERARSLEAAAGLTVAVVVVNLPGNLLGGWLNERGWRRSRLIGFVGVLFTATGPLIFLDLLPDGARFALALAFSFLGGVLPASVLGAAPVFSPTPRQIGTTNGLLVQGSHLGQFTGPPLVAAAVALAGGWQAGAWIFAACGAGVVVLAALIGRAERRLAA